LSQYRADIGSQPIGDIIESTFDNKKGSVVTIIVKSGIIKKGQFIATTNAYGKIKKIFNENNEELQEVFPGSPAQILGFNILPKIGDTFCAYTDQDEIKNKIFEIDSLSVDNENYVATNDVNDMKIIVKADSMSSIDAIKKIIGNIVVNNSHISIVKSNIGAITENDVEIAKISKSLIVGFNVKPMSRIHEIAKKEKVKILFYDVIYKLADDITKIMQGNIKVELEESELGEALVQQI
jgi:translation initiation factor IF-2